MSAAANRICPEVYGAGSASATEVGSRSCSDRNAAACRVRLRTSTFVIPAGAAVHNAAHSSRVRMPGFAGQEPITAARRCSRCRARRSSRAECSSAMRRTRSETTRPAGGVLAQPRRRTAIQPLRGNARPSAPIPAANSVRSARFQCSVTRRCAMSWTIVDIQPTRWASASAFNNCPVASTTPRFAEQVAVAVTVVVIGCRPAGRPPGRAAGRAPRGSGCRTFARRTSRPGS